MCPKKMGWTYVALTFLAEIPVFFSDLNKGFMGLPYVLPAFLFAWLMNSLFARRLLMFLHQKKGEITTK